jgi:hypothetical protein
VRVGVLLGRPLSALEAYPPAGLNMDTTDDEKVCIYGGFSPRAEAWLLS